MVLYALRMIFEYSINYKKKDEEKIFASKKM